MQNAHTERWRILALLLFLIGILLAGVYWYRASPFRGKDELLHVSFGGSQAFFQHFDSYYTEVHERDSPISVKSDHAGSVRQGIGIASGLVADVVSFATPLTNDTIARQTGYIRRNWREHFPNDSSPFSSTIVFLVSAGNAKAIRGWEDLIRKEVRVMTTDPDASGSGRYAYLATLLAEKFCDGCEGLKPSFSHQVFLKSQIVSLGSNQVSEVFLKDRESDVLLTWEIEAIRIQKQYPSELEIIYPAFSILAEPVVAIVDTHVERRNTRTAAESYIQALYSRVGQEMAASSGFRPRMEVPSSFPEIRLYSIDEAFGGWDKVDELHFSKDGSWSFIRQLRRAVGK